MEEVSDELCDEVEVKDDPKFISSDLIHGNALTNQRRSNSPVPDH